MSRKESRGEGKGPEPLHEGGIAVVTRTRQRGGRVKGFRRSSAEGKERDCEGKKTRGPI